MHACTHTHTNTHNTHTHTHTHAQTARRLQTLCVFVIGYIYRTPMLTAMNAFAHRLPFLQYLPTATIAWAHDAGYIKQVVCRV